uniref:Uncharacterized protein n=1 Tax=Nelumbo nucifera TaxID=4432 RepID=A0A822XGP6_NELNU|nr:TPA_asm: hypothetical protein HUJ06_019650 [Nelumbo nucifera]
MSLAVVGDATTLESGPKAQRNGDVVEYLESELRVGCQLAIVVAANHYWGRYYFGLWSLDSKLREMGTAGGC